MYILKIAICQPYKNVRSPPIKDVRTISKKIDPPPPPSVRADTPYIWKNPMFFATVVFASYIEQLSVYVNIVYLLTRQSATMQKQNISSNSKWLKTVRT